MLKPALAAIAMLGSIAATPALAVSTVAVVSGNCRSVSDARGCLFTGNVAPNTVADIPLAYNLYNDSNRGAGPDIALNYLYKSDDSGFLGKVTGSSNGAWATPDAVSFIAVKAANYFVLYQLDKPATSGSWSTFDIPFKRNPPALSHLAFFSAPRGNDGGEDDDHGGGGIDPGVDVGGVPEPATWAMMITGFGLIGSALRRRRARRAA